MDRDVIKDQFFNQNILTADQFSYEGLSELFAFAERMRPIARRVVRSQVLSGFIMGSFFFTESTRTRISSEAAFQRLGGAVVTFTDMKFSSMMKDETFADTISSLDVYCDIMTLRLEEEGQAAIAADIAQHPVINGGDGSGEHPTQALLDVFTFQEASKFDIAHTPFKIAIVGDLKYGRTVHSLVPLLRKYCCDVQFQFVSPEFLKLPAKVETNARLSFSNASWTDDFKQGITGADIIYMVRPQLERMEDDEEREKWREVQSRYCLDRSVFKECCNPQALITHPGPRNAELSPGLDDLPNSVYRRRQPENGVLIRMALPVFILGKEDKFV